MSKYHQIDVLWEETKYWGKRFNNLRIYREDKLARNEQFYILEFREGEWASPMTTTRPQFIDPIDPKNIKNSHIISHQSLRKVRLAISDWRRTTQNQGLTKFTIRGWDF